MSDRLALEDDDAGVDDPVLLPADKFLPSGIRTGLRPTFSARRKGTEPPSLTSVIRRVEAAIADSSRSSSGRPFAPSARIGATPRPKTPDRPGRRAKF